MIENWTPIMGYEGIYEISNFGNVKSIDRIDSSGRFRGGLLKPIKCNTGYVEVKLCKGGEGKRVSIHRLVAIHFIPNPENKKAVNHIDCNRHNNRINNLEWCTYKENTQHGIKFGNIKLTGEDAPYSKLKEVDIIYIRRSDLTSKELGPMFNVDPNHINAIRRRKTWKHVA